MRAAIMKKICVALCALGISFTAIPGPASARVADDYSKFEINACVSGEPTTLDPTMIEEVSAANYTVHLFDNLMRYQSSEENAAAGDDDNDSVKKSQLILGQAESYEMTEDGLEYTFHLRDDIYWSDGVPVTADDFVYSWRRLVDPASAAGYGFILEDVLKNAKEIRSNKAEPETLGVEAVDEKTVRFSLKAPCAYFLDLCTFPNTMPLRQDVIEKYGREWTDPEHIVTNGAFLLQRWVHDSSIRMIRNKRFYDPAVPDAINWTLSSGNSSQLAAFMAKECDFFNTVPSDLIEGLRAEGCCHVAPQLGTSFLYLSASRIPDWRVRAAICLAIDRQNIIEHVTQGGQLPANSLTANGINTWDENEWTTNGDFMTKELKERYPDADLDTYSGRCELAQKLLEEAVADGFDKSVHLDYMYTATDYAQAQAEAIQSDLSTVLDLNVTLTNVEAQTSLHNLQTGNITMSGTGWVADYNDPKSFLLLMESASPYNASRWSNEKYDALLRQAETLPNTKERDELLAEAEQLLFSENGFCIVPLFYYTQPYCIHDEAVRNVVYLSGGEFLFTYATTGK